MCWALPLATGAIVWFATQALNTARVKAHRELAKAMLRPAPGGAQKSGASRPGLFERVFDRVDAGLRAGLVLVRGAAADADAADLDLVVCHDRQAAGKGNNAGH
jgi:hypothetical protein